MNPEHCPLGKHKWLEKGEFARPDFLLQGKQDQLGIVRVDGAIHDNRKHIISDSWQVRRFHACDVKVFIVRNEHIDGFEVSKRSKGKTMFPVKVPDYMHCAIAYFFWCALNSDSLYDVYIHDKEVRGWLGLTSR
jgi:hypothetical protein